MVVLFIILYWIFVLMNNTTMIPCRRLSGGIGHGVVFSSNEPRNERILTLRNDSISVIAVFRNNEQQCLNVPL